MTDDRKDLGRDELPELPEELEEELAQSLRSAWAPGELDPAVNEALIAAALEDPFAEPTEEEVAESARLRKALEGEGHHPHAELARALRAAAKPPELGEVASERALGRALHRGERQRRGNVLYVSFGAASAAIVALAASWFLVIRPALDGASVAGIVEARDLALSRSTAALFRENAAATTTTERVDRIALARSRDLRSNRYALWGVR